MIADHFTSNELQTLKDNFNNFDINSDGQIDFEEFARMMKKQGMYLTHDKLRFCFDIADRDKNGRIDFEEYKHLAQMGTYPQDETAKAKIVFDSFDTDGNGTIDSRELKAAFIKIGLEGLTDTEILEILRDFDKNDNGVLDFFEFFELLQLLQEQLGD